jgi:hypothetical protein
MAIIKIPIDGKWLYLSKQAYVDKVTNILKLFDSDYRAAVYFHSLFKIL